jgi:hypothetical protein
MAEDWRLTVRLQEAEEARELARRLQASDLEHELETAFHDRVVVSRDDSTVFCYANRRSQAEAARRTIERLGNQHNWSMQIELERWHPVAERWEPPGAALPVTAEERLEERAELIDSERDESREQGFPVFEVRVQCESRRDAEALAQRLAAEGIPTAHRWRFVVAGADDEDSGNALAKRIREEAPPGTSVTIEGSVQEVTQDVPYGIPFSPFSVLGGLGG